VKGALADTHALLWWLSDDPRLSHAARELIATGDPSTSAPPACGRPRSRRLPASSSCATTLLEALVADGFVELATTARHALEAARLPPLHRDPFDRMIVAQARVEGLAVITADPRIAAYGTPVLW
jgi:PIN domain nuclease of toxin-antitoxin system